MTFGYAGFGKTTQPLHNRPFVHSSPIGEHRARKPVATVEEYAQWLESRQKRGGTSGRHAISPTMLRRLIILTREGENFASAKRLLGCKLGRGLYHDLPDHLK